MGEAARGVSAGTGRFFLIFDVGSGGSGVVGGFVEGRDGWGIVDAMVIQFSVTGSENEPRFLKSCLETRYYIS